MNQGCYKTDLESPKMQFEYNKKQKKIINAPPPGYGNYICRLDK